MTTSGDSRYCLQGGLAFGRTAIVCIQCFEKLASISPEYIPCIDLILHIVEHGVITVGDNGLRLTLELVEVVDKTAAKECRTIFKCWLVDDDLGTLGLDALHDTLNARLAEIVAAGLHRQPINTDHTLSFFTGFVVATMIIYFLSIDILF